MPEVTLCALDELPDPGAQRFDGPGYRLVIVRIGDQVYALNDRCSHQDFPLSEGEVDPDDMTVECAKHGSVFDLRTGEPLSLPATQPVPVYGARVEDGKVVVAL